MSSKLRGVLVCLIALQVLCGAEEEVKKYTTKYDNLDIDAIIKSERLLSGYVGCLLDEKPCTPDGTELKKNLPDALATDCKACSEMQKTSSDKLSHYLIDNRPDDWERLETRYDPSGSFRRKYLESKVKKMEGAE